MSPPKRKNTEIKFKRGFKIPTQESIRKALNITISRFKSLQLKSNEDDFLKLIDSNLFRPLQTPKDELDWLAQFCESGQTCNSFLQSAPYSVRNCLNKTKFIYVVQLGDFDFKFDDLIDYGKRFFTENVIRLYHTRIEIKLEKETLLAKCGSNEWTLKFRQHEVTGHYQIHTTCLFSILHKIKPEDASSVIAMTNSDLYYDDTDLFLAGLCNPILHVAVFSSFRYNPKIKFCEENWYDIRKARKISDEKASVILLMRTCKLMVHEICHLLGMDHCVYMNCCMNGSGHLKEDFQQSMFLCPVDLKKILLIFDLNVLERYKKLKSFFDRFAFKKESKWLENIIKCLEK